MPNSLLSPLPSPLPHDVEGYDVDFSMDLDPILPPPGLVDINTQPGRGLPTFSIDDELIQQGETQFLPIPLDSALPFIVKAHSNTLKDHVATPTNRHPHFLYSAI